METVKKPSNRRLFINLSLLIIFTLAAFFILFKDINDIKNLLHYLTNIDLFNLLFIIVAVILFFLCESLIITILVRKRKEDYTLLEGFNTTMIGAFGNAITPFNSGGQLVQIYSLKKQKVNSAISLSVLLSSFIIYQFAITVFSIIFFIMRYSTLSSSVPYLTILNLKIPFLQLAIIGFLVNALLIVILFLAAYSKKFHHFVAQFVSFIGSKLKSIKDREVWRSNFDKKIDDFKNETIFLFSNKLLLLEVLTLQLIKLFILYMIPFLAFRALNPNIPYSLFIDTVAAANFLELILDYFPIPGASGGSEVFFTSLFSQLIPNNESDNLLFIKAGMFIWRIATFYFGLVVGLVISIFFTRYHQKRDLELEGDIE